MVRNSLFKTGIMALSAMLIATGVAIGPVGAAWADEGVGSTSAPSPAPTDSPSAPQPTDPEPTDLPTGVPGKESSVQPTEQPAETPLQVDAPLTVTPEPPTQELAPRLLSQLKESSRALSARDVTGADFRAGNIISDYNFFNRYAMTEVEIQTFLDARIAKVGGCTSNDCLAVLKIDTTNKTWRDTECAPYVGAKQESVARILYRVQSACGVSAKVLLVLLQKEQQLLSSPDPTDRQLRAATGAGCPDTAACADALSGLYMQLYAAGDLFTWYGKPSSGITYFPVGKVSRIAYQDEGAQAGCGTGPVLIENRATAALYYYTPYQPNAAALSNLYGKGDACSAYGNRNFWIMYYDWFGDPTDGKLPSVSRISGADRFSTAIEISKSSFPSAGVAVAYVTTGEGFADALSAAPAAATQGGPLLLTFPTMLPGATLDELTRLKPQRIVVVGGEQAVDANVFAQLQAIQPNIQRLSGVDRYETSRIIASTVFPRVASAYVATGLNYPDALSASAAAGAKGIPVLLVDDSPDMHPDTLLLLRNVGATSVKVVGGANAVSGTQESGLRGIGLGITRLAGADRIGTSIEINADAFPAAAKAYLATAVDYPDALAGAAAAGRAKSPLFVSFPGCMPAATRDAIVNRGATSLVLLGGTAALSSTVAQLGRC